MELGLQSKDDAVELPLIAIEQVPDRAPTVIPAGTGIVEVCDKLGQALLMLGAPGTGARPRCCSNLPKRQWTELSRMRASLFP